MKTSVRALSAAVSLSAALAMAACAGSADSAEDEASARLEPTVQAPPAASVESALADAPAATIENAAPPTVVAAAPEPAATPRRGGPSATEAPSTRPRPTPRPALPAGTTPAQPSTPAPARFIAAGTTIAATMDEELKTGTTQEGDRFHARIVEDVLGANGEVLLPAGAIVNGRVTTSHASTGPDDLAALDVEVESITVDGRTLPLSADVVELEMQAQARDSNTRTAAKVWIGAAAGAVVGRILGSDKGDAAKGAAVGAAAGAAAAIATRDGNAVVKPGARMVVRLTDRLVIERSRTERGQR